LIWTGDAGVAPILLAFSPGSLASENPQAQNHLLPHRPDDKDIK
jgi:hypothetical protein